MRAPANNGSPSALGSCGPRKRTFVPSSKMLARIATQQLSRSSVLAPRCGCVAAMQRICVSMLKIGHTARALQCWHCAEHTHPALRSAHRSENQLV